MRPVYFLAMASVSVLRDFDAVVRELQIIHSLDREEDLLQWQLTDIIAKEQETKAAQWCVGASELCKVLRRMFSENSLPILRSFHRWAGSNIADKVQAGLCFLELLVSSLIIFSSEKCLFQGRYWERDF